MLDGLGRPGCCCSHNWLEALDGVTIRAHEVLECRGALVVLVYLQHVRVRRAGALEALDGDLGGGRTRHKGYRRNERHGDAVVARWAIRPALGLSKGETD